MSLLKVKTADLIYFFIGLTGLISISILYSMYDLYMVFAVAPIYIFVLLLVIAFREAYVAVNAKIAARFHDKELIDDIIERFITETTYADTGFFTAKELAAYLYYEVADTTKVKSIIKSLTQGPRVVSHSKGKYSFVPDQNEIRDNKLNNRLN